MKTLEALKVSRELLYQLTDSEECELDHHGYCQTHNWFYQSKCSNKRALEHIDRLDALITRLGMEDITSSEQSDK